MDGGEDMDQRDRLAGQPRDKGWTKMPEGNVHFPNKVAPSLWRDCLVDVSRCGHNGWWGQGSEELLFGVI